MLDIPARASEMLPTSLTPHEAREAVEQALKELGWQFTEHEEGIFRASVSINLASFGEAVSIRTRLSGFIEIESRCSAPWQIFDWGKNRSNIRKFVECLRPIKEWIKHNKHSSSATFEGNSGSRVERLFEDEN